MNQNIAKLIKIYLFYKYFKFNKACQKMFRKLNKML